MSIRGNVTRLLLSADKRSIIAAPPCACFTASQHRLSPFRDGRVSTSGDSRTRAYQMTPARLTAFPFFEYAKLRPQRHDPDAYLFWQHEGTSVRSLQWFRRMMRVNQAE